MNEAFDRSYFTKLGLISLLNQFYRFQHSTLTAVYGTVRTVVWEVGGSNSASYPILHIVKIAPPAHSKAYSPLCQSSLCPFRAHSVPEFYSNRFSYGDYCCQEVYSLNRVSVDGGQDHSDRCKAVCTASTSFLEVFNLNLEVAVGV